MSSQIGGLEVAGSSPTAPTSLRQGFGWQAILTLADRSLGGFKGENLGKAVRRSLARRRTIASSKRDAVMRYVYLIRSVSHPDQTYIGITDDLKRRVQDRNSGDSPHTSKHRPWNLTTAVAFTDDRKAAAFEQYLKSGSGRAFAMKHFW